MAIRISYEGQRGCGFRKEGGLYLVCDGGPNFHCGKLPLELTVCPTCTGGIKPSRAWTWVDADKLLAGSECKAPADHCASCPMDQPKGRAGLLWIGGKFYPTAADFLVEARRMGFSRRIPAIPKDLVLGETWVLLAHREHIDKDCTVCGGIGTVADDDGGKPEDCEDCKGLGATKAPAIFSMFQPTAVEKVVTEDLDPEEVAALEKRGISPVHVKRMGDQAALPGTA